MVKIKILVIDDEVDFCLIMKSYFEKKKYEVFLAYTLKDGLNLISKHRPDIIFLDNNLPDGEGWKLSDEIVKSHPSIKLYLISAYKQRTNDLSALSNIKVWEKPISIATLEEVF